MKVVTEGWSVVSLRQKGLGQGVYNLKKTMPKPASEGKEEQETCIIYRTQWPVKEVSHNNNSIVLLTEGVRESEGAVTEWALSAEVLRDEADV